MAVDKVEDFGEKIGGARKDWAAGRVSPSDVDRMTAVERDKNIRKSYIWPTPDYKALIEEGSTRDAVLALKCMREEIPSAPIFNGKANEEEVSLGQKKYVEVLARLAGLEKCRTIEEMDRKLGEIQKPHEHRKWPLSCMFGHVEPLLSGQWTSMSIFTRSRKAHAQLRANPDWPEYEDKAAVAARKRGFAPFAVKRGDDTEPPKWAVPVVDKGGWRFCNSGSFCNPSAIAEGVRTGALLLFLDKEEAWKVARKMGLERLECREKEREEARARVQAEGGLPGSLNDVASDAKGMDALRLLIREGAPDWRSGEFAEGDRYMSDFKFRGGEFGNWTNQSERKENLNQAYDALRDLAALMGTAPESIGLGGNLAIAFGSRGKGGKRAPAAHYEPGREVINLTRFHGQGCLAHEWAHALDHRLARAFQTDAKPGDLLTQTLKVKNGDDFRKMPDGVGREVFCAQVKRIIARCKWQKMSPPEFRKALQDNVDVRRDGLLDWLFRGLMEATGLPDNYTVVRSEPDQKAAHIEIRKELRKAASDFIAAEAAKISTGGRTPDFDPPAQWRDKWVNYARERATAAGIEGLGRARTTFLKQSEIQVGLWGASLRRAVEALDRAEKMSDEAIESGAMEGHFEIKREPTKYFRACEKRDLTRSKPYYTLPEELFARAFEAFILDKGASLGVRNDYLVSQAVSADAVYPRGEELAAISECFEDLNRSLCQLFGEGEKMEDLVDVDEPILIGESNHLGADGPTRPPADPASEGEIKDFRVAVKKNGGGFLAKIEEARALLKA